MFFVVSKILTILLRPLFWALLLGIWALVAKKAARKKKFFIATLLILFLSSNKVLVNELAIIWEPDKNQMEQMPRTAILLGGFSRYDEYRNQISITEAGERLFKTLELYQNKRIDTIIITGGSASLSGKIKPESIFAMDYLIKMGVDSSHIWIDTLSKNTHQNAVETAKILRQIGFRKAIIITSAFHMPRALKTFKKQGLEVVPLSVQFLSNPHRGYNAADFLLPSSEAMFHFDALVKEWVGYLVYRITGKA